MEKLKTPYRLSIPMVGPGFSHHDCRFLEAKYCGKGPKTPNKNFMGGNRKGADTKQHDALQDTVQDYDFH